MLRTHLRPALVAPVLALLALLPPAAVTAQSPPDYDIVYVRQPRYGNETNTIWPETAHPARAEPGADLVLLHSDGTEEVLVTGGHGSVTDPFVSFDARWIYYSYFYDLRPESINPKFQLPLFGADIFRINVETREIEQLTHGEFTPNMGAGNWDESDPLNFGGGINGLGYGILNLGPAPLPGGKIAFTSNRTAYVPPHPGSRPTLQLFVMDEDGSNVTAIAPMTIGSALHPVALQDGRVMFSTFESQGVREGKPWGLWAVYPDGRNFEPLMSAYVLGRVLHFATQMGDGDIVLGNYYQANNNGFGILFRFPVGTPFETPAFYSAFLSENPDIWYTKQSGTVATFRVAFSPWGIKNITPFTHKDDAPAPEGSGGELVGKITHPSAAPDGDLLVVWTPGAANHRPPPVLPYYDGGIYVQPAGAEVWDPDELILVKNDPNYNEAWPRAVVPYQDIHGITEPVEIPWLPNDGYAPPELPAGTPYGLDRLEQPLQARELPGLGRPESDTFDGLDAFNTRERPERQLGLRRAPTPASTPTATSGPCASSRWSPTPTAATAHTDGGSSRTTPTSGCASSARSRCARPTAGGEPISTRGQSGHQLPGQDPRRHTVHLPDARSQRHGAQHGPDLAPGAAGRGADRLRRLPRAQPAAARLRADRGRASPSTRSRTSSARHRW